MKLRWQNKRCTAEGLRLMEDAVKKVEERLSNSTEGSRTINDELYENCISVAVAPNASEGCCFRGMECSQFELDGKVYNIAVLLRRVVKDTAIVNPMTHAEQQQRPHESAPLPQEPKAA